MSDDDHIVPVKIADKHYEIKCPREKAAQLQQAVSYYDRKLCEIRDTGKLLGLERVAIMTGLNITHELVEKQKEIERMEENIRMLQKKIEETLQQPAAPGE